MQRYSFIELRQKAKEAGVKCWGLMSKDELCLSVNIVRIEHEPKYILENSLTGEITKWRSVHQMSKGLHINPGNIFYAIKKGRPLKVNDVKHTVEQLRD